MSPPRQPSPQGDTTSDAEDKSDSARRVTLESLECLLHLQDSQREQELAELARLGAFSLTRPVVPSDRAQRDAVLSAASVQELGDALRRLFTGPDSSAVIANLRSEPQVVQQINSSLTRRLDTQSVELADFRNRLNVMTLECDRLLDMSKQSNAFTASLRKSVAELETQAAVARSQADAKVAAAFRHAGSFKRQVQDRDQEIPGPSSAEHPDSSREARRLSHPVSATAAGFRRKPHQPPDQLYSIPLPGEVGHEEVMDLLAGDDLAARAARPASVAGDEASFDFHLGDPLEDVELDSSAEAGMATTSSARVVSTAGSSSAVASISSPVTATSSATVTIVVSSAPTVDSVVESCSAHQDSSTSTATSSSAATASSSAVLVSMSSCSTESASADPSLPTLLPGASTATGSFASCSVASTMGLVSSAELGASTSIMLLAPLPTSGVVTPASSSAGPVVASAPVLSPALTPEPSLSPSLSSSSTASSTAVSISASRSAVITTSVTSSAAVDSSVAGSVGVFTSVPCPVGAVSVSTPNSPVLRVLGCSRQTPAHQPSGVAPTVVKAVPGVSSTSTRPTVPTSGSMLVSPSGRPRRKYAAIAASLLSHYLTELDVSDRVALGLGGSAEASSDSMSRGAGSSVKPLELLSGSSDAESDSVAASSAELESSRGQTGDQATTAPHPKARALSSATSALDGDVSSDDSGDISLRDPVSRMQTGRVATHGKAQSYLALGRTPPSSPRSSDSAGALSARRSCSVSKKKKEKKERRKHKHRHKHKRRLSELEDSAGLAGDGDRPRRSKHSPRNRLIALVHPRRIVGSFRRVLPG
ncbi:unnamed protein product [Phytophthora fragariaefolia]|uniref:Unnamed protein product n=1 Tax=Phytophthora fragariaefolia TaxID=1490495 RepID=A0A9W6TP86_9STRA|nr:unnamed protein product [Phytophthora fragariaefolia]